MSAAAGAAGVDSAASLTPLERRLLDEYQRDLPLTERPFATMAEQLGCSEAEIIASLQGLRQRGLLSRVGAVLGARPPGASVLAALCVPETRLEQVAELVNGYEEVNHNYAREHVYNLWFVVVAADSARLREVLDDIAARSGLSLLELPLERAYHIDLGFRLWR